MSDRPGVGAPTHDGADSEPTGRGARDRPATAPKRRRAADLFGSALGAEPAGGATPPGVPSTDTAPDEAEPRTRVQAAPVVERLDRDDATPADRPVSTSSEPRPQRRGPLRARQVHRIIRRVDPWSVLKLSLVFYLCVWLMVVITGVLIWGVAVGSGSVDSLEEFIARLLAFETFSFNADQIFRLFAMGSLIMVFLGTAVSAILSVLFNLISDLIGGIRITVIEEETTRRVVRRR